MSDLFMFVILSFFVFRVSLLITADEGPFEIMQKFRNLFLQDHNAWDWLARGVRCLYCVSFWIGIVTGYAWALISGHFGLEGLVYGIVYGLGLSGLAIWIYKK